MAGAKRKAGRRYKFEKVDLAALDSKPESNDAWIEAFPGPPLHASPAPSRVSEPPGQQQHPPVAKPAPRLAPSAGQADVSMQLDDSFETPTLLHGQKPERYVHLPYQTIKPTVGPWMEGLEYGAAWEPGPWCEVDNDWSKSEVRDPKVKRSHHTDKFGARPYNLGFRGKQYRLKEPKHIPLENGELLVKEKWDPTKLYTGPEKPATASGHESDSTVKAHPRSRRMKSKQKKANARKIEEFWPVTKPRSRTQSSKQKLGLHDFPDEILERILTFALRHPEPLDVDIHWQSLPLSDPSPLDARILRASNRLYGIGIGIYYSQNTWRVDISECVNNTAFFRQLGTPSLGLRQFQAPPKHPEKEQWTTIHALHIGRECVHRIILKNKYSIWDAAVPFLYGFDNLKEVGFDLRPRNETASGWVTVPLNADCQKAVENAGTQVTNLWVGHYSAQEAQDKMGGWFTSSFVQGAQPYITGKRPETTITYDSDEEI